MRTLTEVFAARGPLLPEGLRTLEVSPNRVIEPGMTVHAAFTFRNLGGGTATGFRVRFRLPEGLTYLVGTARIDDTLVDEAGGLTTLLQSTGADIGEVPAGGERRISLAYTVATTIENGTPITLQAAISSFEVPAIGSNIVRLVVRSRPVLQNPKTKLALAPVRDAQPGDELQLSARVHNSGQSSAHDLIVLLPVPANTAYVAQSATVDGRAVSGANDGEPFGFARPSIVAPTLGPGATIDVGYRVRIDSPLEDGTPVAVEGAVCSQEVPEFDLGAVTLKIPSAASFAGDDTSFTVDADDVVEPGQRVRVTLRAKNVGTSRARKVRLKVGLPENIAYSSGSLTLDGTPVTDREGDVGTIALGDLEPGRSVEIALAGIVRSPIADAHELRVTGLVAWGKEKRTFERILSVRSAPRFPAAFNRIERESARRLAPGDTASYAIALQNLGTDAAAEARLHVIADAGLEQLRVHEGQRELPIDDAGMVALDTLEPNAGRVFRVTARIGDVLEDQTQLRLRASLLSKSLAACDLGTAVHAVASRPRFSSETSRLAVEDEEALRPNRLTACRLVLANEGTDRGRDVRVKLELPEELRLERVDDATRDGNAVVVGDIPAGEKREITLHLRLVGTVSDGDLLDVAARVGGANVVPFMLGPIELVTHAEASFAEGATLSASPADAIDAGAEITYTLSLRNCGDGAAKRLTARLERAANAVYAPGSTTVNDIALQDFAGTSPLLSDEGLTLADVGAGVEVIARWRMIVNTPLPPGTSIETGAVVHWDEAPELHVAAEPVRVRSAPALPIIEPHLPFSVLGAAAQVRTALPARREPSDEKTYHELPPAVPVGSQRGTNGSLAGRDFAQLLPASTQVPPSSVALFLDLSDDRLEWTVQYLEQTRVGGLIAHLLALRALFPDNVEGAEPDVRRRLRAHRDFFGELADRLFIKARMPDFALVPDDLETQAFRDSLADLVEALAHEPNESASSGAGLRLVQTVERRDLTGAGEALARTELVTAAPWQTMAFLIGTRLERDGGPVADVSRYREALMRELAGRGHLAAAAFVAALSEPVDPALDAERDAVLRALGEQRRVLN